MSKHSVACTKARKHLDEAEQAIEEASSLGYSEPSFTREAAVWKAEYHAMMANAWSAYAQAVKP